MKLLIKLLLLCVICFSFANSEWKQLTGPYGGHITSIVKMGNTVYAGTYNAGVFRSIDDGTVWNAVNEGFSEIGLRIRDLVVYNSMLIAMTEKDGVYILKENVWLKTGSEIDDIILSTITVLENVLIVGTYMHGVYSSNDSGETWVPMKIDISENAKIDEFFVYENNAFAFTSEGTFTFSSGSEQWENEQYGFPGGVSCCTNHEGVLFAGIESGEIFRSLDYGNNWVEVKDGSSNEFVYCLATGNGGIYAGTVQGLYLSTDNGDTWQRSMSEMKPNSIHSIGISDSTIFVGTAVDAVLKSDDGGKTWSIANQGIINTNVTAIAYSGETLYASSYNHIMASSDDGKNWNERSLGLPVNKIHSIVQSENKMYTITEDSGAFEYATTNLQWKPATVNGELVRNVQRDGNIVTVTTDSKSFYRHDSSTNWEELVYQDVQYYKSLSTSQQYCGKYVFYSIGDSIICSNDFGQRYSQVHSDTSRISMVRVAVEDSTLLLPTTHGAFFSENDGKTWKLIDNKVLVVRAWAVRNQGDIHFIGTNTSGIYFLNEDAMSWVNVTGIVPPTVGIMNQALIKNDNVYIATNKYGIWKRPVSEILELAKMSIKKKVNSKNTFHSFKITENMQNVVIRVNTNKEEVFFALYDLSGKKVWVVLDATLRSGEHVVKVENKHLSPGCYLYRCRIGGNRYQGTHINSTLF